MLHLSDISVLIQHVPAAERAHRLHIHHQQWVRRAKPISITWWLGSRSAILSEALLTDMQNMILRGKRIQMPWQPTCCWVSHEHKPKKKLKSKVIILVFLRHIRHGTYSFNSILSNVWKEENAQIKNITMSMSLGKYTNSESGQLCVSKAYIFNLHYDVDWPVRAWHSLNDSPLICIIQQKCIKKCKKKIYGKFV